MEVVVSYYSSIWFSIFVLGVMVFGIATGGLMSMPAKSNPWPYFAALGMALLLILAANSESHPPETNVVTLAPGEELVGSHLSEEALRSRRIARVIVRLADGKLSVRDVTIKEGEQLEIRSSTPIER